MFKKMFMLNILLVFLLVNSMVVVSHQEKIKHPKMLKGFCAASLTALAVPISLITQPKEFIIGTLRLGKQIITQPRATGLAFGGALRREPEVVVGGEIIKGVVENPSRS